MCHELIDPNFEKKENHAFQGENGNLSTLGWKYNSLLIVDGVLVSNGPLHLRLSMWFPLGTITLHECIGRQ